MKIVIDEDILYAYKLFSQFADVELLSGRDISFKCLKMADALIVRSITQINSELLDGTRIKFVGTVTSGVDHVDQDYLLRSSIFFSSAFGCNAIAVAEYVFSVLLWIANRDKFFLCDRVVGIVGVGNIGRYLHRILNFFGITTLLCDPILEKKYDNCMCFCSLEKLVTEADILTFHVPLIFDQPHPTWHMVERNFLESLLHGCILINTSRGSVFDNIALLDVLKSGKKIQVILDVWENEPKILYSLLKYIDICTPHIAGYTIEGKIRGVIQVFNDFKKVFGVKKFQDFVLFPMEFSDQFEIYENINQNILFCLSNFVYNVFDDDIRMRCSMDDFNFFDVLRKGYLYRREWSSIYIKPSNVIYANQFKELGFSVSSYDDY